jgi:hypothetical protein
MIDLGWKESNNLSREELKDIKINQRGVMKDSFRML